MSGRLGCRAVVQSSLSPAYVAALLPVVFTCGPIRLGLTLSLFVFRLSLCHTDVSKNNLVAVPDVSRSLPELEELHCAQNCIELVSSVLVVDARAGG